MKDSKSKKTKNSPATGNLSRRSFLKGAATVGVAVTAGGVLAQKTIKLFPTQDIKTAYMKDVLAGDTVLRSREYVVMTDNEKRDIVKFFKKNYKSPSEKV
ncbi:MAG: twin-arginine translocation signal domain-containing protein [Thermodesulfobacteriota bacterium]